MRPTHQTGMKLNALLMMMGAAMFGGGNRYAMPVKADNGELPVTRSSSGSRTLNQRQKRKLWRQNPHLRNK